MIKWLSGAYLKDFEHVQDPQKYTSVFLDSFIAPDRAGGRGWGQEGSSWGHSQQGQQGMVAVHGKEAIQARLFFFFTQLDEGPVAP